MKTVSITDDQYQTLKAVIQYSIGGSYPVAVGESPLLEAMGTGNMAGAMRKLRPLASMALIELYKDSGRITRTLVTPGGLWLESAIYLRMTNQ